MIDLIKNNIKELEIICEKHKVRSLYLFGSAAKNEFKPKESDLDFVVEFNNTIDPIDFADNFFSLLDALKDLFKTEVDLLSYRALKNQIMKAEIDKSKVQLYAA